MIKGLLPRGWTLALGLWAALCGAAPQAAAEPALWAVRNGGSTVYLFGTVHLVKVGTDWEYSKIITAFDASKELWLEITDDDPETIKPLMAELAVDPAHPLAGKLTKPELARLDVAAKSMGLPGGKAGFDGMRPWAAAIVLTAAPMLRAGYDPGSGVDRALKARAIEAGKPVRGFETSAQQLHFFADLPEPLALDMLRSTLRRLDGGADVIDQLSDAWLAGDVAKLDKLTSASFTKRDRALYRVLFDERNEAWAEVIADRLATSGGVTFVAVGAGHLSGGKNSLQAALAKRGLRAERQ